MMRLLKPKQVDCILLWPLGKTARLAKQGKIPHIVLPDRQIRIASKDIDYLLEKWRNGGDKDKEIAMAEKAKKIGSRVRVGEDSPNTSYRFRLIGNNGEILAVSIWATDWEANLKSARRIAKQLEVKVVNWKNEEI